MYKTSPSMLESFRVFKNEIYDTTVEQMIAIIKEKDRTLQLQMFSLLKTKASEHKMKYNGVTKLFEVE